jgi:hypothetical protein
MNRKYCSSLALVLAFLLGLSTSAIGQDNTQASARMVTDQTHFHPGSDLTFKMTLNEPLPEGAHFNVRLSPIKADQQIDVSSGEPTNKERTEFILHTKLPDGSVAGEWHIKVVWLFLAGAGWTNNTLSTNDMQFVVEGPKIEIPTKATATIVQK